jgi:ABC-type uncharacterized transport system permease subunit
LSFYFIRKSKQSFSGNQNDFVGTELGVRHVLLSLFYQKLSKMTNLKTFVTGIKIEMSASGASVFLLTGSSIIRRGAQSASLKRRRFKAV